MSGPGNPAHTYNSADNHKTPSSAASGTQVTQEHMLLRRCDYLEKSEKAMKESLKETVSERKRMHQDVQAKTRAMYDEMQWVYGKTTRTKLMGRKRVVDDDTVLLAKGRGTKVLLLYPMKQRVSTHGEGPAAKERTEYLMRCKTVDPETAQLSIHWVVVQDSVRDASGKVKAARYVDNFSLV